MPDGLSRLKTLCRRIEACTTGVGTPLERLRMRRVQGMTPTDPVAVSAVCERRTNLLRVRNLLASRAPEGAAPADGLLPCSMRLGIPGGGPWIAAVDRHRRERNGPVKRRNDNSDIGCAFAGRSRTAARRMRGPGHGATPFRPVATHFVAAWRCTRRRFREYLPSPFFPRIDRQERLSRHDIATADYRSLCVRGRRPSTGSDGDHRHRNA